MGPHPTKKLCTAKETINKMKLEPTVWENIFTNDMSNKGLITKIYKELTWGGRVERWRHQAKKNKNSWPWTIVQ